MKKTIITGALLIAMIGFNEVNILPTFLSENIVHANTKVAVNNYDFYVTTGDGTFLSTKDGQLVVWKTNANATPAADVTITKSNGTKLGPFDPASEKQTGKWINKGELETGDTVEIVAKQDWKNYRTPPLSLSITTGNKIKLGVNSTGSLEIVSTGVGQAQVTYNVNTADPDDPTANPDFTVLIPTEYQLSNKQKVSAGAVALKDAKDVTQNYTGDKAVKVAVTSAKNFQFDNGGTYKLVDGNKAAIPAEITLNKTAVSSVVNAQLIKEGSKTASADMLTFNYTVAP